MSDYKGWLAEKRSAYLYRVLGERVKDQPYAALFIRLGKEAEKQATLWEQKLRAQSVSTPAAVPLDLRTRAVSWLIRHYQPQRMLTILAAVKIRGLSVFRETLPGHEMPTSVEHVGQRHGGLGATSNLRAAIFGVNDGLVSNAALIMGMTGAESAPHTVLIAGAAGLFAGAFSMAAGEYVSVRSQREMFEYQIGLERDELLLYPNEEEAELSLIYEARGLKKADADDLAKHMMSDHDKALDALAREELGLNPADLASPIGASSSSFLSFAIGALIPLLPFIFLSGITAQWLSISLTAISLFLVGMAVSLFTGKSAVFGGLRMLSIGAAAAATTYFVGHLFGVSLA